MIKIDVDTALKIHALVVEKTGGSEGTRDLGLLDGALSSPYQTFGGDELYPTPPAKAAHLGYAVIKNHPFVDGNKRTGVVLMLTLLDAMGVGYTLSEEDVVHIGMSVAAGEMTEGGLLDFISERLR